MAWGQQDTRDAIENLERRIVRHANASPILDPVRHAEFQRDLDAELVAWREECNGRCRKGAPDPDCPLHGKGGKA
jgi:hypothetical protein